LPTPRLTMIDSSTTMKNLRRDAWTARRSMTASERARASRQITDQFLNSRYFFSSEAIACYVAAWDEVDTSAIIERAWCAKKRVFLPVIAAHGRMFFRETLPGTDLARNDFGLWEPVSGELIDANRLDVVVAPLVVFDTQGSRIGMGGGYFDRAFAFLAGRTHWLRPKLIGVAFECQRAQKITRNPWDIPVFRVLTEVPCDR
jgi:5-formyltetrahydrofolate cyclo-ligase